MNVERSIIRKGVIDVVVRCPLCSIGTLINNLDLATYETFVNGDKGVELFPSLSDSKKITLVTGICTKCQTDV